MAKAKSTKSKKPVPKVAKKSTKSASSSEVMKKIKAEQVKMRPGWHFGLLGFVLGLTIILVGFMAAIGMSAIVDEFREASNNDLFELRGGEIVGDFPWLLLVLTVIAIYGSVRLVKRLDFSYQHKNYIMFGSLGLVLVLGASFMNVIGVSEPLRDKGPLRPFSTLSKLKDEKLLRGELVEVSDGEFGVQFEDKVIEIGELADIAGYEMVEVGDEIVIFGEYNDDESEFEGEIIKKPPHKKGVRGIFDKRF